MLGLRVRGRGGRDRTAPVAAPISAFLWGSTPFLCARAKKWGGTGRAGAVYCLIKRRTRNRARQGGLVIVPSACAPILWEVVVSLSCDSTPFLWCLPKETVSSRQRKALFYLGVSTIRVSATSRWTIRSSPDLGEGAGTCAPFSWVWVVTPYCQFHPISLLLRKETGWSPKETRLWVPPREVFGPARLSHGLEAPTSQPTASS